MDRHKLEAGHIVIVLSELSEFHFKTQSAVDRTTSHINYKLFSEILVRNGLEVEKVVPQSEFLQKVGIIERANILSKNKSFKVKVDIFYKLKKLLDLNEMGNLFKVLFAKKRGAKFSLGFN